MAYESFDTADGFLITDWNEFKALAEQLAEEGYIPIYGEFNSILEVVVINLIHKIRASGRTAATLLINSGGGDDPSYAAIVGAMKASGMEFTGVVIGYASSNAAYLLQVCAHRQAFFTSTIMLHWGCLILNNRQLAALVAHETWPVDDAVAYLKQEVAAILDRSGLTFEEFSDLAGNERHLNATLALEMGLLDEIVDVLSVPV